MAHEEETVSGEKALEGSLEELKQAEAKAEKLVLEAKKKREEIILDAKKKAEHASSEANKEARDAKDGVYRRGNEEIKEMVGNILSEARKEASEAKKKVRGKTKKAAALIEKELFAIKSKSVSGKKKKK